MRFGSVDTFLDFEGWGFRMGRPVANEAFLGALLLHGSFEAFDFYCPDAAHAGKLGERLDALLPDPAARARARARSLAELPAALATLEYGVFHQGDFTHAMPFLPEARRRFGKSPFPITGVTHSLDGAPMQLRFLQLLLAGLEPFDTIVCTSRAGRALVEHKLVEVAALLAEATASKPLVPRLRTALIPLGVDESLFAPPDREEARRYLAIPPEVKVILSVGRLSLRTKFDPAPLVELCARMAAAGELERTVLIFAGGGSASSSALFQSLIDAHGLGATVMLLPNFAPELKRRLYHAADIYLSIVDNYQETLGLSVIEAMAAGLPVIASDFDGYRDAVVDGETGLLVPTVSSPELPPVLDGAMGLLDPGVARLLLGQMVAVDLGCLRAALLSLCADAGRRRALGEAGRRRAERYRWRTIIAEYEALWRALDAEAKGAPLTTTERARGGLLAGEGMRAYAHFPTRQLAPSDGYALTEVGRAGRTQPGLLTRYEDLATLLSPALERLLLDALGDGPRTVGALRACAREGLGATAGECDFLLLWLYKHGAVEPA